MPHLTQTSNLKMMQPKTRTQEPNKPPRRNNPSSRIQEINQNITDFLMKRYFKSADEKKKRTIRPQKTLLVDLAKADVEHLIKISKNVKYNLDDILSNIDSSTFDSASNHSNEKDNSGRVSPKY
ncbi:hypothetical protein [Rickettsiella massiliensis]|uniref:hypothetical protein n=1 Tax=Rickettsiella massiliensis TaxID=676517 RepID=UPI00029A7B0C|nr:hypothetical protein [Rickettsiella massiliensis]